MKILTVSDLHGRAVWKQAPIDRYDLVIFLGDYTDSHVLDDETIYHNLQEIIQLKSASPNKYVLLIGNHDAQYLHFPHYRCSGFRSWAQPALSDLFGCHRSFFQIAHQQESYLFTHAGITNHWLKHLLAGLEQNELPITPEYNLATLLNQVHQQPHRVRKVLFDVGPRRGGYAPYGGPLWADRSETKADYLTGFHQVVGHTPIAEFTTLGDESGSITYTDVLQTQTTFYEITIPD
ncbi:metallophosphoesterase [Spirosoma koreense]